MPGSLSLFRLLLCACALATGRAQADTIYYPRPEAFENGKTDYGFELLQLALAKAHSAHHAELAPEYRQQNRAIMEVIANRGKIHVVGTMTSIEREVEMLPIRIPISKGLIGWRILLIRDEKHDRLRNAREARDLREVRMALGHDWPDLKVLRSAGLQPDIVPAYSRLLPMLKAGRIDAVPRSINEVFAELEHNPGLTVEPYLVLHYKAADYFFVNYSNKALAEEIRRGLEAAQADGSFDRLLLGYYGPMLDKAALAKRRVIELPNPYLPPDTPLKRKELWLTYEQLKR